MRTYPVSHQEVQTMWAIAAKAVSIYNSLGKEPPDQRSLVMALMAAHSSFCPLQLERLLEANMGDFTHDIGGILNNMNDSHDDFKDGWQPRYAYVFQNRF